MLMALECAFEIEPCFVVPHFDPFVVGGGDDQGFGGVHEHGANEVTMRLE